MRARIDTQGRIRGRLERDLVRDPGILILAYPYARMWQDVNQAEVWRAWSGVESNERAVAYIHVPFCWRKCTFCDFLAYYGRPHEDIDRYVETLTKEISLVGRVTSNRVLEAVHFGGGTPSLLNPSQIGRVLDAVRRSYTIDDGTEITIEVFPDEHVSRDWLAGWRAAGVNRLSFGVQFLDDELKRSLNRTDASKENLRVMHQALDVGLSNINVDLMCGLPGQEMGSWRATLEEILALTPGHVCVFPVSVRHPGIPLYRQKDRLPPMDTVREMYDVAAAALSGSGYERTTRHNFVRPEARYVYERCIAQLNPVIGLGVNSISYARDLIYRNHSSLQRYSEAVMRGDLPVRAGHRFASEERAHNYAVRGIEYLRLDGTVFESEHGGSLEEVLADPIAVLTGMGLGRMRNRDFVLTDEGVYYSAAVKRAFFHESVWERLSTMKHEDFQLERDGSRSTERKG